MLSPDELYPHCLRFGSLKDVDVEWNVALAGRISKAQDEAGNPNGMFDRFDCHAIAWIWQHGAELLTVNHRGEPVTDELRRLIRETMVKAMTSGDPKRHGHCDLTQALLGYSPECCELIVRTEISIAQEYGALLGAKSMVASCSGVASLAGLKWWKRWLISNSDGVCSPCMANAQQGYIGLDIPFASGALTAPDHVKCRCGVVITSNPKEIAHESNEAR